MLNPGLVLGGGTLTITYDPHKKRFPDDLVLAAQNISAADNTFSAPVMTGCGPGGSANIPVDTAIDTTTGLPSASGNNGLTLTGNFYVGASLAPTNPASNLLAAFKASVGDVAQARARQVAAGSLRPALRHVGLYRAR